MCVCVFLWMCSESSVMYSTRNNKVHVKQAQRASTDTLFINRFTRLISFPYGRFMGK